MYIDFFGFKEKPFEITPDPKFIFLTPTYREMLAAMVYGITERRGFIAMIGEVGSGKTLLLNTVQGWLNHKTKFASIFNSDMTFKQMLLYALWDLEIIEESRNLTKAAAIQQLNNFALKQLEDDGNLVLFIDEAQNLSPRTLENIRMLGNLETRKQKLVQIVLAGQPELDKKLSRPDCRQLAQRIGLKVYAEALSEQDTYSYIMHRLKVAGYKGPELFSEAALKNVWLFSLGIPRKINLLCDSALLHGYGADQKQIDENIVHSVAGDMGGYPSAVAGVSKHTEKDTAVMKFESMLKKNDEKKIPESVLHRIILILAAILFFVLL
jgi:general secretion pathway protein A